MGDETNANIATNNTFTIDGSDLKIHRWNQQIQCMEWSFKVFCINEELQVQYLLHYIGMQTYNIL